MAAIKHLELLEHKDKAEVLLQKMQWGPHCIFYNKILWGNTLKQKTLEMFEYDVKYLIVLNNLLSVI